MVAYPPSFEIKEVSLPLLCSPSLSPPKHLTTPLTTPPPFLLKAQQEAQGLRILQTPPTVPGYNPDKGSPLGTRDLSWRRLLDVFRAGGRILCGTAVP